MLMRIRRLLATLLASQTHGTCPAAGRPMWSNVLQLLIVRRCVARAQAACRAPPLMTELCSSVARSALTHALVRIGGRRAGSGLRCGDDGMLRRRCRRRQQHLSLLHSHAHSASLRSLLLSLAELSSLEVCAAGVV